MLNSAIWISIFFAFSFALFLFVLTLGVPLGEYIFSGVYKVLPTKTRIISSIFLIVLVFIGMLFLQKSGVINELFNPVFANSMLIIYTLFLSNDIIRSGFFLRVKKKSML